MSRRRSFFLRHAKLPGCPGVSGTAEFQTQTIFVMPYRTLHPVPGSLPLGRWADEPPRRRVTECSHRADEPPSARAPEKRAHLARTGPNNHSRRTARLRCPDAAAIRLLPPLVARPLTTLGHSQWPEPPRFSHATASSPAAVDELTPSRDPTTRPLRASPRRP